MCEQVNREIERINNIDWSNLSYTNRESDLVLAKEYIRRSAVFMKSISQDVKSALYRAADIYTKDYIINIDDVCPKAAKRNLYERGWCRYHLEWLLLANRGESLALEFSDLYEPIIRLYERGVILQTHDGFLEVGGRSSIYLGSGIAKYSIDEPFDITEIH